MPSCTLDSADYAITLQKNIASRWVDKFPPGALTIMQADLSTLPNADVSFDVIIRQKAYAGYENELLNQISSTFQWFSEDAKIRNQIRSLRWQIMIMILGSSAVVPAA